MATNNQPISSAMPLTGDAAKAAGALVIPSQPDARPARTAGDNGRWMARLLDELDGGTA